VERQLEELKEDHERLRHSLQATEKKYQVRLQHFGIYLCLRTAYMMVIAAVRRPLRSADNRTCLVKRSRNQFGDHCFAINGPTLWNSLPEQLRQPDITIG